MGIAGASVPTAGGENAERVDRRPGDRTGGGPAADAEAFDPAIHGYGFPNWDGDRGVGADGESFTYERAEISLADVRERIQESWTTALSEAQTELMARIVYSWIGGNAATNGHCYGMAFTADDYYRTPSALPDGVTAASEIPRPTGEYAAVGDRIRVTQSSQLLRREPFWFALFGLRWGLADHVESIDMLTDAIDETGTGGVSLDGDLGAHQVLAHDYERHEDATEVLVYDPNVEAPRYERPGEPWTLTVDRTTGDLDVDVGYDEFLYHDPEMEKSALDRLVGGPDAVLGRLDDATFLALETGGTLELAVPDDVLVDRPTAEYADDSGAYADAALVVGAPAAIDVTVDGQGDAEYVLETLGVRGGEVVLDRSVSDTLADATPVHLRLAADEAEELVLQAADDAETAAETVETEVQNATSRVERGAEAATERADGATDAVDTAGDAVENASTAAENASDGTPTPDDGGDWIDDGRLLGAVGGALGLGIGLGYRLLAGGDDGDADRSGGDAEGGTDGE